MSRTVRSKAKRNVQSYSYNVGLHKKNIKHNKRNRPKLISHKIAVSENVKRAIETIDLWESVLGQWETSSDYKDYQHSTIICLPSTNIDMELIEWAFQLCKNNVKKMYEDTIGWDENAKYLEMTEEAARYLFIKRKDTNKPVAFSHFRFDMDYGEDVLYCYELHVIPEERGKGFGGCLLNILELFALTFKMSKVILTVFKANDSAVRFYKKRKFEEDYTSPKDKSYIILSKYMNSSVC